MKCPYCDINELVTTDVNGMCSRCFHSGSNHSYPADIKAVMTEHHPVYTFPSDKDVTIRRDK